MFIAIYYSKIETTNSQMVFALGIGRLAESISYEALPAIIYIYVEKSIRTSENLRVLAGFSKFFNAYSINSRIIGENAGFSMSNDVGFLNSFSDSHHFKTTIRCPGRNLKFFCAEYVFEWMHFKLFIFSIDCWSSLMLRSIWFKPSLSNSFKLCMVSYSFLYNKSLIHSQPWNFFHKLCP